MQLDVYDIIAKTFVNMWDSLNADPVFLIFLIVIVVIAILKAIKTPISSKEKGAYGEILIENELNRLAPYGQGEKIQATANLTIRPEKAARRKLWWACTA